MKATRLFTALVLLFTSCVFSQKITDEKIKEQIIAYKNDIRGPYRDIRWFCTDGSIRQPKDPCPDNIGPGVQHARYKDAVIALGKSNHIYFGQILAATNHKDFWDAENNHSRLKQYQLDKYIRTIDNGWINQKSQFYRGSLQIEDEQAWGIEFYKWLLKDDQNIAANYFLIRQSLKDIPHNDDDNTSQLMRSQSKVISDLYEPFMNLRVKIHSQPEFVDIEKVRNFKTENAAKLTTDLNKKIDELVATMKVFYKPIEASTFLANSPQLKNTEIGAKIATYAANTLQSSPANLVINTAQMLLDVRDAVSTEKSPIVRLQLLDISIKLEEILFKNAQNWAPEDLKGLLEKVCYLGMATAGSGYIETWEWEQIMGTLSNYDADKMSLNDLTTILESARSEVEWSAAMVKANYQDVVNQYTNFEPKAYGFVDDKIRGSIALYLGQSVGQLGDFIAKESALSNKVIDLANQSSIRGLNPGYAYGELVVVDGNPDGTEVAANKIYIFERPPADLKPVAGIATVAEGNMVSHVQLLARNLGIPNAALSDQNLRDLLKYNGKKVFYAVSNKGNVIIKLEKDMTSDELALFAKKERKEERIEVPVEQIKLAETKILNLRSVDASDSGKLCGPKAANLGQLKKMFPDNVVEGLVIPFGIFRQHMNQIMPGRAESYWTFLNNMFDTAEKMRASNTNEEEVEAYQLKQLETLRGAIKKMPLNEAFTTALEKDFQSVFGKNLGNIPVFLRSDTNMEDLKDFTGAGLNLTLFNVVDKEKIIEGIKDVWASPYTERSFKWRQKYLLNPENVFPSILVIPSVDVDYSGVLITKGLSSGNENDLTVAFSRGAGGAVDGQSAETYLIKNDGGYQLLAPAREPYHNTLPVTGGTGKKMVSFEKSVLNDQNIKEIKALAQTIRTTMAKETNSDYKGAYDVELGFKENKLWLFQIRPFVENKKALSSTYLESITPKIDKNKEINLSTKL
ncbi:PEP/pyruvate-binding domain-containing protein [Cellulophaga tyrosinoxydans]|uniref:Phosphoenolpyruvate synthase n=1 Tax=Cellulophaga tyrosinoxydans TaxID=504486 RepID=A0A1W2BRA0_9FLAO|nr:PEP/pyruvate-binding domain-containing protein [Cellulophaga tyrosinoxydans]SMC75419.1 Pyruvate phosphate dikinase, PEP/pyruvate binding domain [Cellulophaga tyrosinoxydans]